MDGITRLGAFGYGTRVGGSFFGENAPPVSSASGELAWVSVIEGLVTNLCVACSLAPDVAEVVVTLIEGLVTTVTVTEEGDHE